MSKKKESAAPDMKEGIRFKKAMIVNDLFLSVQYDEELPGHSKNKLKNECTVPVHDDLKTAFARLHRHLALLCSMRDLPVKKQFYKTTFEEFTVTGFTIGGNDDSTGVCVIGFVDGAYGPVNLTTPLCKYTGEDYPFVNELSEDVIACEYEIDQYLFKGKKAPEVQLSMEMPEVEEDDNGSLKD